VSIARPVYSDRRTPRHPVFCRDAATRNRCEQLVPTAQFFRKIGRPNVTKINAAAVGRGLSASLDNGGLGGATRSRGPWFGTRRRAALLTVGKSVLQEK
jgi:hypothetical protein